MQQYITLKDSLFNIEQQKLVLDLETLYEMENKELELQIAKQDKALQEAETRKQKIYRNALIIGGILVMIILLLVFNNAIQKILIKK